jgi:hypothetical protein
MQNDQLKKWAEEKYAAVKKSALDLAHKHGASRTATLIDRGASPRVILKAGLDEVDVPAVLETIYVCEREEWEHGYHFRFPKLTPHQATKFAAAILQLKPRDLRTVWVSRALFDAPGFKPEDRAKLFDAFVTSDHWVFLPDGLEYIPDITDDERARLHAAIKALLPNEWLEDRMRKIRP